MYEISFHSAICYVVGIRGMFLRARRTGRSTMILNFSRIPRRSLTAGRQLRPEFLPMEWIGSEVLKRLVSETFNQIKRHSLEAAALWRLGLKVQEAVDGLPVLFPCRSKGGLEWLSLDSAIDQYGRLLLVPFDVAWHGTWEGTVPCVGILTEQHMWDYYGFGERQFYLDFVSVIGSCRLVQIPGVCSSYLWPPEAPTDDLHVVTNKATYTPDGVMTWESAHSVTTQANAIRVDRRLVATEDLPDYDRNVNPWEEFGLRDPQPGRYSGNVGEKIREVLESVPPLSFEETQFEITLEDADDWE